MATILRCARNPAPFERDCTRLGQQIEDLVQASLKSVGDTDAETMAKRAPALYSTRSKLVHGRGVEAHVVAGAAGDVQQIVQRVLKAKVANLRDRPSKR